MELTDQVSLLPAPRILRRVEGVYSTKSRQFVLISNPLTPSLLRVAHVVRQALIKTGSNVELTASDVQDATSVIAKITLDNRRVNHPQGYHLSILPEGINLVGHDDAGLYYGAMTLKQITRQFGMHEAIPCMAIEDWPDFHDRGVMLDISRDRVPTMESLYSLIDMLSELKINQFQLYTEHTYAYRSHDDVWGLASPVTGEQVLDLDTYCKDRFVELVPNQNSFGHMERWLTTPGYRDLAEDPESDTPRTINPMDPRSVSFFRDMYEELLPHFGSTKFNIGCDEVPLGDGSSKDAVAKNGVGRVYLDFLLKIHGLVKNHGRTMQFWGDIVIQHPELIPELPHDVVALEWGYEGDHPFRANCEKFAHAGIPFYVCPGTSSWNSISGRTDNAKANILNAAEAGLEQGAIGLLNTDWGDSGHWQQRPVSYPGYCYGAAVSWCIETNRDIDLPAVLDIHVFQDSAGIMGKAVCDLGNTYRNVGVIPRNGSVLHHLLLRSPGSEQPISQLTIEGIRIAETHVQSISEDISKSKMLAPDAIQILPEMTHAAELLIHACHAGMARLTAVGNQLSAVPRTSFWTRHHCDPLPDYVADEINKMPTTTRAELSSELGKLIEEYRALWLARCRLGGLEDSVNRWEQLLAVYDGS